MTSLEVRKSTLGIASLLIVCAASVVSVGASPLTGQLRPVEDGIGSMIVTKTADTNDGVCDSDCSLREAIAAVQVGGLIHFGVTFGTEQTITLTLGELTINKSLTLTGPGARLLTISGNNTTRVFQVTAASTTASIAGVTIANGQVTGSGGGIRAVGIDTLNLTAVTLRNNRALGALGLGGGIIAGGTLNIARSTISNNFGLQGGGINVQPGSSVNISNSTISGNVSTTLGGAMICSVSSAVLNNVTITRNSASEGGGIWGGGIEIRNSIIADNASTSGGPGHLLVCTVSLAVKILKGETNNEN